MFHPIEAVHWVQTQLNRPSERPLGDAEFWSLFEHEGQPLTAAPSPLASGGETELLVVVTTFQRAESCAAVLSSLARALEGIQPIAARVIVLHDRDRDDYQATRALARSLFGPDLIWLDARIHLGKAGYWKTYQTSFLAAQLLQPQYALYLQDDVQFADSLLVDTLAHYEATQHDPLRRVLYLYSSAEDERHGRWIRFERAAAGEGLALTQWFDLQAFFADRTFFECLGYRMIPIHPNRWRRRESLSSGVGRQLTFRLRGRANIYQARPPLVFHGGEKSAMNPSARTREPLDNRRLRAVPGQKRSLRIAVVVGEFPELSATFILDHIIGLLELGHDVQVFARPPTRPGPVHSDFERYRLAERTHYFRGSARETQQRALDLLRRDAGKYLPILARSLNAVRHGSHALSGRWFSYTATMLSEPAFDVVLAQFGTNGRIAEKLRRIGAFDAPIATVWLGYDLSRIIREHGASYYRDLFAHGDLMLPLSEYFRRRLIELGCSERKLVVHHLGVDPSQFTFSTRTLEPGAVPRIVTVCRLVEKKGLDFALRALAQVAASGHRFEYHLIGDGPLRAELEALRGELALSSQVTFHGAKTREQVKPLLAGSHVFLAPSVTARSGDEEGTPAAIMEAMAMGLPVVSTIHSGIPEVVQHEVSGYVVPEWNVDALAHHLRQLLGAPECWEAMGRAGRSIIERDFDVRRLNDTLSRILMQLAEQWSARSSS